LCRLPVIMLDVSCAGRIALVTGGSRGIGRACALALADGGAKVAIGYRSNAEAAAATVQEITAAGGTAVAIAADVATVDGCTHLHEETVAKLGTVDILVNCAGGQLNDVFMLLADDKFEARHSEHVMSVVRMTRLVASGMLARKWGRIINMSSVASVYPGVGQANYAAAKGAVEALTISMAVEFAKRNVTVNCMSPGLIDTDMAKQANVPGYLGLQLIRRLGRPDEVAAWVMMLCSKWGEMMTGQIIGLDGGYRLAWNI
jgi:3-oxoacyl-[acyl-carrier protein] reductase